MKSLDCSATILSLVDNLNKGKSWCGDTHIQKCAYLLQEMFHIDLGFNFILYKHGPFSFDFSEKLQEMLADGILTLVPPHRYKNALTREGINNFFGARYAVLSERYKDKIVFVTKKIGNKGVGDLEKIATAFYVTQEKNSSAEVRATYMHELKPHISFEKALSSIKYSDNLISESHNLSL